jgi:hypothetical protein
MAFEPKSVMVEIPWQQGDEKGFFSMALGTAQFLGLPVSDAVIPEVSYSVGAKTISRKMYPGGPTLGYDRAAQTITRSLSAPSSTAKGSNRLVLVEELTSDTIYYTGNRRRAVAWLKANGTTPPRTVQVKGKNGGSLAILGAVPLEPLT